MKYEITQRRVNDEGHEGSELELKIGGSIWHTFVTYDGWDFTEEELRRLMVHDLREYLNEYTYLLKILEE
jgi:hypothetical protein